MSRADRLRLALFAGALLFAALQIVIAVREMAGWGYTIPTHLGFSDFGSFYQYAWIGWHHGWGSLYDIELQRRVWLAMGGQHFGPWFPMVYPPFIAWLVAPFALLPFTAAAILWFLALLTLFIVVWKLTVPGEGLPGRTQLALAFSLYPVVAALLLGQPAVVSVAAVALCWWLLKEDRPVLAGLVLALAVVKPQVGFLVPLVLLVSGRWRALTAWLAAVTGLATLAVVSIGADGVAMYASHLRHAREWMEVPNALTIPAILGASPLAPLAQLAIAATVLAIAFRLRHRRDGIHLSVAAALVGGLLILPYAQPPDLMVLVVAAWISLNAETSLWSRRLLIAGYVVLAIPSFVVWPVTAPIFASVLVGVELVWLASVYPVAVLDQPQAPAIAA